MSAGTYYYRLRAENSNSFSTWSNTATATVTTAGAVLTIIATPMSVTLPTSFILSGHLTPPVPGDIVTVYVMRPGSARWSYSSNRLLDATSNWWYSYTPTLRGTYRFYAQWTTVKSRDALGLRPVVRTPLAEVKGPSGKPGGPFAVGWSSGRGGCAERHACVLDFRAAARTAEGWQSLVYCGGLENR